MTELIVLFGIQTVLTAFLVYLVWAVLTRDIEPTSGMGIGILGVITIVASVLNVSLIGLTSFKTFLIVLVILTLIGCVVFALARRMSAMEPKNREVNQIKDAQKKGEREIVKQLKRGVISHEEALEYVSGTGCGSLLQFLSESLRDDRLVVAAAIAQPHREIVHTGLGDKRVEPSGSPLEYASINCRQDRELVLEAISFSAEAYNYASEDLRADPEIYLAAARAVVVQTDFLFDTSASGGPCRDVFDMLGHPNVDEWFGSGDKLKLYEFVVALERLFDHYCPLEYADSYISTDDALDSVLGYWGEEGWDHAGDNYEEHFLNMFQDWEVVCRVLECKAATDDPYPTFFKIYKDKWSERYDTYAPGTLYQDESGMKTDKIVNRAFVLYALKAGHTHVMNWVTDTLKDDPEVSKLLNVESG
jgi:hypothetical protein